jgi:hypothetical protein
MKGDVHGQLDHLLYEASCTVENDMKEGNDTIIMLMGALKYVARLHPNVQHYSLNDEADKLVKGRRIMITPRRLLQGKSGWYQKHFGAHPASKTQRLLQVLQKPEVQQRIREFILTTNANGWGDYNQISEVATQILPKSISVGYLWGTEWYIPRKTISKYAVDVSIVMNGGSKTSNVRKLYQTLNQKRIYLKRI